ncbi:phospho-sugar mutase [Paenibacillus aquistagni]|uniref:Phosphoglucomutase n=1 Tax=Paenibacillus aquistagni TaxID=1852522 RepID=A0A1X7LFF6_9BACL|nr:phospho-sugar mutase [Paenibacillus aquistagni]SMG52103.1 phosphoglucomutase [Paenibacillus aquistagni]
MTIQEQAYEAYQTWLNSPVICDEAREELRSIANQEDEITDRFYKELEFGTGGLRGVIGYGTNRINVYTVGKATQGLAATLAAAHAKPSVAIAYDSRHFSPEFALEAALVLAGNGVRAYVFESLRPTPELSFAVRHLQADAGIVITASHNPPEYNGYKVYGGDGGQITPETASRVIEAIRAVQAFEDVKKLSREQAESEGLLVWLGEELDKAYIEAVAAVSQHPEVIKTKSSNYRIVYTPLHGTGNMPVRAVLDRVGFREVHVVPEQEKPDANFSTVQSPNPEEHAAFEIAIRQAKEWNADLIMGTDPDADRMGAVIKDGQGEYFVLSGNQSGAIMVHYLLESMKNKGTLPANGAVVKTIVTSEMGAAIAKSYGMTVFNTLTGFKYIGEKMTEFQETGAYQFIFGYEESYGYLAGMYARDKDAVIAAMLISEAGAYYKAQGKSLYEVLQELYETYGYFAEKLATRTLKGMKGVQLIASIMEAWRNEAPAEVSGVELTKVEDFSLGLYDLPKENVLKFHLADGSWFCLRPSGTEPKIKMYFAVQGESHADAQAKLQAMSDDVLARIDAFIEANNQ